MKTFLEISTTGIILSKFYLPENENEKIGYPLDDDDGRYGQMEIGEEKLFHPWSKLVRIK